jgi:3-deoxy-manno-octulosonate cytidylyltransferase (CMP-KDO synthetase)
MDRKLKMKVLGLIPSRIGSQRLPAKALLPINGIPLVIHTYKRASLSKLINKIMICTDSKKITTVAKKFKAKSILTSQHHKNGTERITEAYVKEGKNYDLVLDIQGDEPLISPYHIDEIIKFHEQNKDADIILPTLKVVLPDNPNVVKVVSNKKNEVLYLSRAKIPYESKLKCRYFLKHLSIISFKPEALIKFAKAKRSYLEKIEDIELLRALEIGLKIKTVVLKGDSFSVDVIEDYERAKDKMLKDKFFKLYK